MWGQWLPFYACLERTYPDLSDAKAEKCATAASLSWILIQACTLGSLGLTLQKAAERATPQVPPWRLVVPLCCPAVLWVVTAVAA